MTSIGEEGRVCGWTCPADVLFRENADVIWSLISTWSRKAELSSNSEKSEGLRRHTDCWESRGGSWSSKWTPGKPVLPPGFSRRTEGRA